LYNILSNYLLYLISNLYEIYNYADDNSICVHGKKVNDIVSKIESVSKVMFSENNLQTNPDKSQFILVTNDVPCNAVNIDNIILHPFGSVKLLGVHIDRELNFNGHVTRICHCHPCSNLGVGISEGCFIFDFVSFITFGGRSAHLAYYVYKSGRKTTIIIIIVTRICRKAGRQLNTLERLANVQSVDDKNILFECFI